MACLDENALVQLAEGILPDAQAAGVEDHIDRCEHCATLVAEFARTMVETSADFCDGPELPWLRPGEYLGRYVIAEQLGAGGMGQVYAADDPDLGRQVAIKIVQTTGRGASDERLIREAKAMAQLAHPNVVAVHDVGMVGKRAFIAMELVVGTTLAKWSTEKQRAWHEVVEVFAGAGRGLAAAHDAGIVHRDFKPGNVLLGEDGRAQVTDFGLARSPALPANESPDESPATPSALSQALTETGTLMGTPAYMAPEQLRGGTADARSDQFAFCVALYESLYGRRPFAASDVPALARQIETGVIRPTARETEVPERLRRIVERGLSAAPDQRFESMHALIAELTRDSARTRRRRLGTAAIAIALAASGFALYRLNAAPSGPVCGGGEEKLAEVWNAKARRAGRKVFAASSAPLAQDAWARVEATLDSYAEQFSRTHKAACEATHVRGEQSAEVLDLRMACLDRRLGELDVLLDVFSDADDEVVENAIEAAHSLQGFDACTAVRVMAVRDLEPEDAATATKVNEMRPELARVRVLRDAGKWAESLALANELVPRAKQIGYRRLESRLYDLVAEGHLHGRDLEAAEKAAHESLLAAEASGDSGMVTSAALSLAHITARDRARSDEAARWVRHAAAALENAGPRKDLQGSLASTQAFVAFEAGDYAAALEGWQRSAEIYRETLGPNHPNVANMVASIGAAYYRLGRYRESVEAHERSLAMQEAVYGTEHPSLVGAINDLGAGYERLGELDRAIEAHHRSIALRSATYGDDSPRVATGLNNLALALESKGELAEAQKHLERAAEIYEENGLDRRLAAALINLGAVLSSQGQHEAAEARSRRALELCEQVFGRDHPHTASALTNLGEVLCTRGKCAEAVPLYQRSLEIRESKLGNNHIQLTYSLRGLAIAHRHLGAPDKAIPLLERALSLLEGAPERELDAAKVRFNLARAMWDARRERKRAIELARAALERFTASSDERAKEVAAWLVQHGDKGSR